MLSSPPSNSPLASKVRRSPTTRTTFANLRLLLLPDRSGLLLPPILLFRRRQSRDELPRRPRPLLALAHVPYGQSPAADLRQQPGLPPAQTTLPVPVRVMSWLRPDCLRLDARSPMSTSSTPSSDIRSTPHRRHI